MGLFDKIKKVVSGGSSSDSKQKSSSKQKNSGQGSRSSQSKQQGSGGNNRRRSNSQGNRGNKGSGQRSGQQQRQGQGGSNSNRRRRSNNNNNRSNSSSTRTVTRSDASRLKEQKQGTQQANKSGARKRSRRGGTNRHRERTRRGSSSSGSVRRVLDANERPKDPVKKQILINALDPNEIRVAIREQQQVVEVYVERRGKRSLAGNIYKGRVQNVLPGMEACFVDIGLERNGFLYVDEITPEAADSDQVMEVSVATEVEDVDSSAEGSSVESSSNNVETLEIDDAMEEEDRELEEARSNPEAAAKAESRKGRGKARIQNKKKIQDLLKQGQEILVQVVKDPMGTKGSRLTTQYSLAGRYLVFVPDGDGLGVSRRLEDTERDRLREIVKSFELPSGGGLIVRTAAEGARKEDIAKDLDLLIRLHEQLMEKAGETRAPKLLYNEADLSLRIIRDLFNAEVEEVLVDDKRQFQRISNYLKRTSPELAERVRMHDGQRPLFEAYGVEDAIRSTLSKRADLPSGGYLIIDKTEAFHVIDVNSGRNVGKASLEETITKTNMEAAAEVVRQLRLRDLGGIIVIDFIDMNQMKNRDAVLEHFRKELSKDRTKTYLVEISPLGLVEMTRQNVSEGVREILTSTCRVCEGRGVQISPETHAIEVERAVADLAVGLGNDIEAIAIEVQPDVAKSLAGNQGKQNDLDRRAGKHIRVFSDPDLAPNAFALMATGTSDEIDEVPNPLLRGEKYKVTIEKIDPACDKDALVTIDGILVTVIGAAAFVGEERSILVVGCTGNRALATLAKSTRRRRRRGGKGRKKEVSATGVDNEANGELVETQDKAQVDSSTGAESSDDEFEYFEEDVDSETKTDPLLPDEVVEPDDERTEIPQRLIVFEEEAETDDASDDDSESDESSDSSDDSEDEFIDAIDDREFDDDLLAKRGVTASSGSEDKRNESDQAAQRRRRRRGSRGGRNRNRTRTSTSSTQHNGGQNKPNSKPNSDNNTSD